MNKQIAPAEFGGPSEVGPPGAGMSAAQKKQIWSPIRTGGVVIAIFVVGLFIWAAFSSIAGGVPAPGVVAVQNNRKTVQHLDGGIVREIRVREGDRVAQGQVLVVFDDTQARASVEVMRNQYDSVLAERARLEAELTGARAITWPAELLARRTDPRVVALIRDQESLFRASLSVYESQVGVLGQRAEQYRSRLDGLNAQIASLNEQSKFIDEELTGVASLAERGFAPRSRVLALQRSASALTGDRGARTAEVAGVREAIGESQIQLAQLRQQRTTTAAEALREVQVRIADVTPRLRAAEEVLARTSVRSPATGYVLGLTQFTEGGVAAAGSRLLDIVPADAPLVIRVRVRPDHIDEVRRGMTAQVRLTAFSARQTPSLNGTVVNVSADQLVPQEGPAYFEAELVIDPAELRKLPPEAVLAPGMPAQALIVTGERSVLSYMISPLTDTLRDSLHEP
jgi:HlyD family secretion protein